MFTNTSKAIKELLTGNQTLVLVIGILFFCINFSGDHVFYKTNTLKIVLVALSCTVLALIFVGYAIRKQLDKVQSDKQGQKLFVYLGFSLLPIIATLPGLVLYFGEYSYMTVHELTVQLLCVFWGGFILIYVRDEKDIVLLFKLISISISYMCIIGLLQKLGIKPLARLGVNFFEANWAGWGVSYEGFLNRISSTTGNPNYFAGLLIQLVPVFLSVSLISLTQKNKSNVTVAVITISAMLLILNLANTGSRGGVLACIVSVLIFSAAYLLFFGTTVSRRKIIWAVILLAIFIGISAGVNVARFKPLFSADFDLASLPRFNIWKSSMSSVSDSLYLGHGIGSSYSLFFEFSDPDIRLYTGRSFLHPHNDWIEILQEGGVFGLVTYLSVWGLLGFAAIKFILNKSHRETQRLLALGLFSGLLAIHIQGLFSVAPRMMVPRLMTYTLVSCLFVIVGPSYIRNLFSRFRLPGLYIYGIGVLLSLCALWLWIGPFSVSQYKHARSIAYEIEDPEMTTVLAKESRDVYMLDRALKLAAESGDSELTGLLAEKLDDTIPHYRETDYYLAYSEFLKGDFLSAIKNGLIAQSRDKFHLPTIRLLLNLSLRMDDKQLFKRQFQFLTMFYSCKKRLVQCNETQSNVLIVNQVEVLTLVRNDHMFRISISEDWYLHLRQLAIQSVRKQERSSARLALDLARNIGANEFFTPKAILNLSKAQLTDLQNYLKTGKNIRELGSAIRELSVENDSYLLAQMMRYHEQKKDLTSIRSRLIHEKSELENELIKYFDMPEFLMRRVLLLGLSNDLAFSIQFD